MSFCSYLWCLLHGSRRFIVASSLKRDYFWQSYVKVQLLVVCPNCFQHFSSFVTDKMKGRKREYITSFSTFLQIFCIITSWFGTKHPLICFLFSCSFIIWNLILCLNYWFLNCKFAMFKLVKVKSFFLDVNCISLTTNIFLSGQYNRYFLSIESNRMMCIQHELLFYWDKRII